MRYFVIVTNPGKSNDWSKVEDFYGPFGTFKDAEYNLKEVRRENPGLVGHVSAQ